MGKQRFVVVIKGVNHHTGLLLSHSATLDYSPKDQIIFLLLLFMVKIRYIENNYPKGRGQNYRVTQGL